MIVLMLGINFVNNAFSLSFYFLIFKGLVENNKQTVMHEWTIQLTFYNITFI